MISQDNLEGGTYNDLLIDHINSAGQTLAVATFPKMIEFAEITGVCEPRVAEAMAKRLRTNFTKGYGIAPLRPYVYVTDKPEGFMAPMLGEFLSTVKTDHRKTSRVRGEFRVINFRQEYLEFLQEVNESLVVISV